ncbi:hypothetical protein J6590_013416 [Homalodisca vitripennis]|nr:hypothetical protein J6590_013416 [Homalodisca vitripennis]
MDHRVLVKEHLGPLLLASPFNKTKIFTFEDSRKFLKYWIDRVMADPYVAEYIDGVSVHWYEDSETSPEILDEIVKKYNKSGHPLVNVCMCSAQVMADPDMAEYIDGVSVHWYEDSETSPEILDEIVKKYNKSVHPLVNVCMCSAQVMADPDMAEYIDGVTVHWYEDSETSPEILDEIVKKYNKFIIYTEACILLSMDLGNYLLDWVAVTSAKAVAAQEQTLTYSAVDKQSPTFHQPRLGA